MTSTVRYSPENVTLDIDCLAETSVDVGDDNTGNGGTERGPPSSIISNAQTINRNCSQSNTRIQLDGCQLAEPTFKPQRENTVQLLDDTKLVNLSESVCTLAKTVEDTKSINSLNWMFNPDAVLKRTPPPEPDRNRCVYHKFIESLNAIYPVAQVNYFMDRLWFLVSDEKESTKVRSHLIVFWRKVKCYLANKSTTARGLSPAELSRDMFKLFEDTLSRSELTKFTESILLFLM